MGTARRTQNRAGAEDSMTVWTKGTVKLTGIC